MHNIHDVQEIMAAFADRTGLLSATNLPRRYLWTDAFAVCNFLELFRLSGRPEDRNSALQLVSHVHHVLGRHRGDDPRRGWISGLNDEDGECHPTRGGLRIGKRCPERRLDEPFNERLEWERDGQYFHYLTRWMHALNRVTVFTGDPRYNDWALELAQIAHARFIYRPSPGSPARMYWKMSIDLSRPLVPSMGHHDPLDAFVTCCRLKATAAELPAPRSGLTLTSEIADFAAICAGQRWATKDTLGIGGLLTSACELAYLCRDEPRHVELLQIILEDAADSLRRCLRSGFIDQPAESRLAFRELGLSIGLRGARRMAALMEGQPRLSRSADKIIGLLHVLMKYSPLSKVIEQFWLQPSNQHSRTWTSHEDINSVMLATSLAPHVYLTPENPDRPGFQAETPAVGSRTFNHHIRPQQHETGRRPMSSSQHERDRTVAQQIVSRGVRDERVLAAMRAVPRERFIPSSLHEFAYEDAPLPIEEGQTISQPYIVAVMIEALELAAGDRVLEIGAGSGYASAVLSRIAAEVFAVEVHAVLAKLAQQRAEQLGYHNVSILHGDGTLGWPEHAPYDAILVSAGGPAIPRSLLEQLKIGGRLVIPVGNEPRTQELLRIRRTGEHEFERRSLGRVQFVPLVGSEGWSFDGMPVPSHRDRRPLRITTAKRDRLSALIARRCEPFEDIERADLQPLLKRVGTARVVLIGEASHGTSEFYRMRARMTRELITQLGFNIVAIEGDWPDTRTIDRYVRGQAGPPLRTPAFSRFPTWMWRNQETRSFVDWLAEHNRRLGRRDEQVSMHGLDVYSLNNSIGAVLDYLERVDPLAAETARVRYSCFSPWETDPATYGRAAVSRRIRDCEQDAVATLTELLNQRMKYVSKDGDAFFDAERNATVVRDAECYYRTMYYGSRESWNLRDQHMFDTLQAALQHRGPGSKAVVWAHNTHVGNAAATEMGIRGELNIGQLARERFSSAAYAIGFGTDHGTVAAASNWDEPMQTMTVRPAHEDSYERLCHETGIAAFLLPLRAAAAAELRNELLTPHLERAIGVIYRPETEMLSHYFHAALPAQFDEYVWFDKTHAVRPLQTREVADVPDTYPFGL